MEERSHSQVRTLVDNLLFIFILKLCRLFTLKGREVKSVSDFFREDDCFIAVGREQLTTADIQVFSSLIYDPFF